MASCAAVSLGREDIDRAAEALASRVPTPLHPLARAAYNLRWSWTPGGADTFSAVDPQRWELCGENPIRLLTEAPPEALERAAADEDLVQRARALEESIRADVARPTGTTGPATAERPVSFFCAEYGIHASLPIYSGGLGALAGDILKEASDRALPLVAVGLLYRQGYFRQRIDASGWQHESWVPTDPERQPMALVTGDDGAADHGHRPRRRPSRSSRRSGASTSGACRSSCSTPTGPRTAPWRAGSARACTPATRDLRLAQYLLLGVGGMRALKAMGIDPSVVHLNEGHAAFASLELARAELAGGRLARRRAGGGPRAHGLHDAHAGAGRQRHLRARARSCDSLGTLADEVGVDLDTIVRLGRTHPDDDASRSASPSSRCTRAARATASAAATARSRARCGPRCGPIARSTTCRSAT